MSNQDSTKKMPSRKIHLKLVNMLLKMFIIARKLPYRWNTEINQKEIQSLNKSGQ